MKKLEVTDCGEKSETTIKRSVTKQITLGLLTNFITIAPSMSLGFSAIAIPALTKSTDPHALTLTQSSWFASVASLATPFGCFLSGPISDKFGRKSAFYSTNIVCFIGWLMIAVACNITDQRYLVLMVARILTGLSTGLSSMPSTVYMAEVSSPKLRGVFCTWSTISFSLGILIVYALGYCLKDSLATIALITAILPCIGVLFTAFLIPESPSWLVAKNRYNEARRNLTTIYGLTHLNHSEESAEIEEAVESLIEFKSPNKKSKSVLEQIVKKIKILLKPTCIKPFFLILTYFFFQQFSGTFVIVFYAIDIVKEADIQLDPYLTIVLIGLTRLIAAILVSYVSKIFGRRPLSIFSGTGMTLSMISLACYVFLVNLKKIPQLPPLPVIALLCYFFTSTLGFLPLPFAMTPEMFSANIRGTASGLISCFGYFFNFITVKIYPTMITGIDRHGVFLFYGLMSLAGTIFVLLLLPETKGKSLKEIEEYFGGKKKRNCDNIR